MGAGGEAGAGAGEGEAPLPLSLLAVKAPDAPPAPPAAKIISATCLSVNSSPASADIFVSYSNSCPTSPATPAPAPTVVLAPVAAFDAPFTIFAALSINGKGNPCVPPVTNAADSGPTPLTPLVRASPMPARPPNKTVAAIPGGVRLKRAKGAVEPMAEPNSPVFDIIASLSFRIRSFASSVVSGA